MAQLLRYDYNRIDYIGVIDLIQNILDDELTFEVDELSYKLYIKDIRKYIRKYNISNYNEENLLMTQVLNVDGPAIEQLFLSNLRLVIYVAKKFQNRGLVLNDLISEGNIGLLKSIQKIDSNRGFRFATYAIWDIKAAIRNAIAKNGKIVHYPSRIIGYSYKIQKFISIFKLQNERQPSEDEISQAIGETGDTIDEALTYINSTISIDFYQDYFDDFNQGFCDLTGLYEEPNSDLYEESLIIDIEDSIDKLNDREKQILKKFFGIGCEEEKIEEIAKEMNLTRERVRQIKEKAIRKLKGSLSNNLKQYLG